MDNTDMNIDNDSILLDILKNKCQEDEYGEVKLKYIVNTLINLNILHLSNDKQLKNESKAVINNEYKVPISAFRYNKEYIQLSLIGFGGFGKVYTVRNILDNNIYALKKIDISSKSVTDISSVITEINILSKLNHPNIVRYYNSWIEPILENNLEDSSVSDDENSLEIYDNIPDYSFYIQMELCSNGNLGDWLTHRNDINLDINKNICLQILNGLSYLHELNIIHRDLKPTNIFIHQNIIKIGDFGLATLSEKNKLQSSQGSKLYIDKFMKYSSPTVDIYSFGIILVELFTIFKTQFERYEILSNIHNSLDKLMLNNTISSIIKHCISENIKERYTVYDLLKHINNEKSSITKSKSDSSLCDLVTIENSYF